MDNEQQDRSLSHTGFVLYWVVSVQIRMGRHCERHAATNGNRYVEYVEYVEYVDYMLHVHV